MKGLPKFTCPHCGEEVEMPCCGNCAKFCQHYGHDGGEYFPMPIGHCTKGHMRKRSVLDKPCVNWELAREERGAANG